MPRHIISQGSKWRPIDDGKHSSHNASQSAEETIVCASPALLTQSAMHLSRVIISLNGGQWPPWLA
eukprot:2514179-Karenia_brevis.AAC.1